MNLNPSRNFAALRRRPAGIAIVYVVIIMLALLGIIGLASDTAYIFLVGHQLQNAADAAALAGANQLGFGASQAIDDAIDIASKNRAAGANVQLDDTDVEVGNYDRPSATFTPNGSPANAVRVTARRTQGSRGGPVNLIFGPIFNIRTSNVSRQAIAMGKASGVSLLVLNRNAEPALTLTGASRQRDKVNISNGGIVVDSGDDDAVDWSGRPVVTADSFSIVGDDRNFANSNVYTVGTLTLNAPYVADPLLALAPPPKPALAKAGSPLNPGYYPNGLPAGILRPGIYWVDKGINLSGNQTLDATAGCLIYLHGGGITMKGNSDFKYAPMSSGPYAGISIFQERGNFSADTLKGRADGGGTGVLYFPSAHVVLQGGAGNIASQFICNTLDIQAGGQLNIAGGGGVGGQQQQSFLVK
ncbi:MAG: hypothetical protein JWO87_4092 [Phycisphaerales bacterium]|nr:hypothetical protein [Phycisphaerales bacterium]